MEDTDVLYMNRIHISDYYEDLNGGYLYGIAYFDEYTPEDLGQMFHIDCEWFQSEEEREEAIKLNEDKYGYIDID